MSCRIDDRLFDLPGGLVRQMMPHTTLIESGEQSDTIPPVEGKFAFQKILCNRDKQRTAAIGKISGECRIIVIGTSSQNLKRMPVLQICASQNDTQQLALVLAKTLSNAIGRIRLECRAN